MSHWHRATPRTRLPGREYYHPAVGGLARTRIFGVLSPLIVLFLIGFAYILHEEFFKGIDMFRLHPSNE